MSSLLQRAIDAGLRSARSRSRNPATPGAFCSAVNGSDPSCETAMAMTTLGSTPKWAAMPRMERNSTGAAAKAAAVSAASRLPVCSATVRLDWAAVACVNPDRHREDHCPDRFRFNYTRDWGVRESGATDLSEGHEQISHKVP